MKKIIVLFLTSLTIFSCSSDDNNSTEVTDPIIGKWQYGNTVYIFSDGSEATEQANTCTLQSSLEFKSDNTATLISYIDDGNGCELEPDNFEYFNWSKVSEGNYIITSKIQGQAEETELLSISFPDNNTMIWHGNSSGIYNGETFEASKEYFNKL